MAESQKSGSTNSSNEVKVRAVATPTKLVRAGEKLMHDMTHGKSSMNTFDANYNFEFAVPGALVTSDRPRAVSVCPYCQNVHSGPCPHIKAIEYYPDGTPKKIEYNH